MPFLVVRTMRDGRMDLFATGLYLDARATTTAGCASPTHRGLRQLPDRHAAGDSAVAFGTPIRTRLRRSGAVQVIMVYGGALDINRFTPTYPSHFGIVRQLLQLQ